MENSKRAELKIQGKTTFSDSKVPEGAVSPVGSTGTSTTLLPSFKTVTVSLDPTHKHLMLTLKIKRLLFLPANGFIGE